MKDESEGADISGEVNGRGERVREGKLMVPLENISLHLHVTLFYMSHYHLLALFIMH